jgi:hypothetical protein
VILPVALNDGALNALLIVSVLAEMMLAEIILAEERILVQEKLVLAYWYAMPLTIAICPFVGDTGKAILYP